MPTVSALIRVTAVLVLTPALGHAADSKSEMVVIGCLTRTAQNTYVIKDHRSNAQYQLHSDGSSPQKTLAWQVGHELEVHGAPASSSPSSRKRLEVSSVIEIASACAQAQKPKT
jgi:hypothetical protein